VHFGEISITNMLGREVARLPIDAFFSLPDALRYREVLWPDSFAIGRYKAKIDLYQGFGDVEQSLHAKEIVLWIFPWQIVLPAVFLVVFLVWAVRYLKKNFRLTRK
jgi:hypothetical protein